jgi:zinc protease
LRLAGALALAGLVLAALLQPLAARDALEPWPAPADGGMVNDPDVVWGRLPNGLRYAIMPNRTPPGRVSLRLLVEAGSLMEGEDQRGLAHFLEHLAFKGSASLAPGELVHFLQRAGLAFGPDTNAQTGFDTTVYQLDLPSNAADLLGQGLHVLSEVQARLLLAPDQIEPERGVILSEKRLRDTPDSRSFEAMLRFLLPGSAHAERIPIGREEVIRTAPRERLLAFYRDYYTPARSVVVVTGDVEPAAVAAEIAARFGGFAQPAGAPADPDHAVPEPRREADALLFSDPGYPASLSLNAVLPFDRRPDSLAKQGDRLRQALASLILGRRLQSLGLRQGAPFTQAGVGISDLPPVARIASLRLAIAPERWREALAVAEQELRRAIRHGFTEAELQEQLAIVRSQLQAAAASASTRKTGELADSLVEAIADEEVFTAPGTDLALFEALVRGLRPADIDRALGAVWQGREPQIMLAGPITLAEPKAEILATYRQSRGVPVAAPAAEATAAFAYGDFGPPTPVASLERIEDLGITRVVFGNGVRLDLKPTTFEADTIRVAVRFGTGRLGMPKDRPGLDLLAGMSFVPGGLGRHGMEEIQRIYAARQAGADLVVGDASLVLLGETTRQDLPAQLDLLAAYVSDPGYRPEAIEQYRRQVDALYARLAAVPEGAVPGPVALLVHDGDPRFGLPPKAEAARRTLAELRDWLDPMLCCGPLQVAVVGDVDPARVIEEVGRTFGALPAKRPAALPLDPPRLALPTAAEPVRFAHAGPAGQALAMTFWPTTGRGDSRVEIGLELVADILGDRLLQEVREREGATYSPDTASEMSLVLPGWGHVSAAIDSAAGDADRLSRLMREVAASMQAGGITQDELDRALQPRLARARTALASNGYWLYEVLIGLEQFPQLLDQARSLLADHESQTLGSVQALASRYLDSARALPVLVVPAVAEAASGPAGLPATSAAAPRAP